MSIHLKFVLYILLSPAALHMAAGQSYWEREEDASHRRNRVDTRPTWEQWSDQDPNTAFRRREEPGSVSVQQLRRPLKGRGRDLIRKAEQLLAKDKLTEAFALLEQAREMPDARPYALSILGTQHLKLGLTEQALLELQQAAESLPENAMIHNNLAYALGMKGQVEPALKEAHKAAQLDPANCKTRFILGALLMSMGQHEEAVYHLRVAATEIPSAAQVLNAYLASRRAQQPRPAPAMSFQPPEK